MCNKPEGKEGIVERNLWSPEVKEGEETRIGKGGPPGEGNSVATSRGSSEEELREGESHEQSPAA